MSDQYENRTERPEAEMIVTVYNINPEMNKELMRNCRPLSEYSLFVEKMNNAVRDEKDEITRRDKAKAVIEKCIAEGILREFLIEHKEEVITMCFWEYDEEAHRQAMEEDRIEMMAEAKAKGMAEGRAEYIVRLICKKLSQGKSINEIAEALEADEEINKKILEVSKLYIPGSDVEEIVNAVKSGKG